MIPALATLIGSLTLLLYSLVGKTPATHQSKAIAPVPDVAKNVLSASASATRVYETSIFTYIPTPTPLPRRITPIPPTNPNDPNPGWGVAQPMGNGTYSIKIAYDGAMTTPSEFVAALNSYRATHGSGALIWDDALGNYAAGRAQTFKAIQKTDVHAGFNDFLNNQNGFATLKFSRLGENSYYGGPVTGTHVVEWVFAQSPGHNANQLGDSWTHIGVGVTETSIDVIFGGGRM